MVRFFIQRPIFASAIAIIMVLAGGISYFLLPVSQFPRHHTTANRCGGESTPAPARRSSPTR